MGRSELPEEEKSSSSYEDVTDEEEEVRPPEAVRPRQPAAAESREPEPPSGRAPALRTEKKATRPAEKEESSDDPRHRRHGRSSSRHREGRRTPSPAVRPRSPTVLPGAFPKSRPTRSPNSGAQRSWQGEENGETQVPLLLERDDAP